MRVGHSRPTIRRVTSFSGGIAVSVGLTCGHTIYGECAFRISFGGRVACPMCAGSGPRHYVAVGRARKPYAWTYELRARATRGRPAVLDWSGSKQLMVRRAADLNRDDAANIEAATMPIPVRPARSAP
jgi:hypothetical protein